LGLEGEFVQDNHSISKKNVLRGLHYQIGEAQAKLVRVSFGEVFDVAVDIRKNSPNFGKWVGMRLSAENKKQMYVPAGFAHGFCALTERAEVLYKCSAYYSAKDDRGILWDDEDIGVDWPVKDPILSEKDLDNPKLRDI
jgi:dTDP-4-dehydrorhamnose 3,5-epimerase